MTVGGLEETKVFFFGASAVSAWAARFAFEMGFPVVVLDCDADKFEQPGFEGCECKLVDFNDLPGYEDLGITKDDMVCVITRGHTYDPQSFTYALKTPAFYVGMMGSAKKNAKVFKYALEHGCTPDQVESAYAPIGESIGAIDASEIGLAIVAQLVHVHNQKYFREKDHDSLHRD